MFPLHCYFPHTFLLLPRVSFLSPRPRCCTRSSSCFPGRVPSPSHRLMMRWSRGRGRPPRTPERPLPPPKRRRRVDGVGGGPRGTRAPPSTFIRPDPTEGPSRDLNDQNRLKNQQETTGHRLGNESRRRRGTAAAPRGGELRRLVPSYSAFVGFVARARGQLDAAEA